MLALAALLLAAPAQAVTIGFDPSTTIASVGDAFTVDVVVSDLQTADGSASLDFVFDAVNDIKGANDQILDVAAAPGSVAPRARSSRSPPPP